MTNTYKFTRRQLSDLLDSQVKMFIEYRDVHGKDEEDARFAATAEMLEGLDADKELALTMPDEKLMFQLAD